MICTENSPYNPSEINYRAYYTESGSIRNIEVLVAPRYITASMALLMNRNEQFLTYKDGEFTFAGQVTYKVTGYDADRKALRLQRVWPAESDQAPPRIEANLVI